MARLADLTPESVRRWHAALTVGPSTRAKAYRLLHAILATAVADERITRNPCVVPAGGRERPVERPIATIPQVWALADAVPARWRCFVLLGAFASLRFGEVAGLTRADVDFLHGTVRVQRQLQYLEDGRYLLVEPKEHSRRIVTLPPQLVAAVAEHLAAYVRPEPNAPVFVGPKGSPLSRHTWGVIWRAARATVAKQDPSLPPLTFHDLRHTGNTLAAATGASTRELMVRMGHATERAALIYQHATRDRDAAIAAALGELIEQAVGEVVAIDRAVGKQTAAAR